APRLERQVQEKRIDFARGNVLRIPRYADDLRESGVQLRPQKLAEGGLVRPQISRCRLTNYDDNRPGPPFLIRKSTAANDRNTNGFKIVWRDRIVIGDSGLDARRSLSWYADCRMRHSPERSAENPGRLSHSRQGFQARRQFLAELLRARLVIPGLPRARFQVDQILRRKAQVNG